MSSSGRSTSPNNNDAGGGAGRTRPTHPHPAFVLPPKGTNTASSSSSSPSPPPPRRFQNDPHHDPWASSDDDYGNAGRQTSKRTILRKQKNDDDPHDLEERFVENQRLMFDQALAEIRQGQKRSCWLWFVLPSAPYVVNGVERGSYMNRHFALRGDDAAKAYLMYNGNGPEEELYLRNNYLAMVSAILCQVKYGNTLKYLLGPLDKDKAISSFRLFARIAEEIGDDELAEVCSSLLKRVDKKSSAAASKGDNSRSSSKERTAKTKKPRTEKSNGGQRTLKSFWSK